MRLRVSCCLFGILFWLPLFGRASSGFLANLFGKANDKNDGSESEYACETVKVLPRIVGGTPVSSQVSAPYIAAVGERLANGSIAWFCGGSILSPRYILTAAHCLTSRNIDVVRVGCLSLKRLFSDADFDVSGWTIHPKYSPPRSYHDIAIIKLGTSIGFTDSIRPVCLATTHTEFGEGRSAKVIGWGANEVGGDGNQRLQQVEVQIFSNPQCDEAYQNSSISTRTFPQGIRDGQLCAGSSRGGKDACQGDSGGPLVMRDNEGITRQIGIVSTGAGCGAKVYPGVYTRISSYRSWINENTNTDSPSQITFGEDGRT